MNKPFTLISAELNGLDVHSNYQRTSELRSDLVKEGLSFVGVTNISAAKKCQFFLVTGSDESKVVELAKKYSQKAILSSDENRNTEVVSTKSNGRTKLGQLTAVSKDVAAKAKFYITFTEEGKEYFYVTKKGVICD